MREFTLCQNELPFGFFEEVAFSYEEVALRCLKEHLTHLSDPEIQELYDQYDDNFRELLYDMEESVIDSYYAGEHEVDEGSGTWGYINYEVPDLNEARKILTEEVESLFSDFVKTLNFDEE